MASQHFDDQGVSLVETMLAVLVAFIAMSTLGAVVFTAMVGNKNQGVETTRMTTLAQEKVEELLRLLMTDTTTNTTLITDAGWSVGLTANTKTQDFTSPLTDCPTGAPDEGYVDFLDANGVAAQGLCAGIISSTNVNGTNMPYGYQRRWRIQDSPGAVAGMKQITVVVYSRNAVQTGATPPTVSVTTFKSQ